jgi:hypothetical protein
MTRDLLHLRQGIELFERPRLLVVDLPADFERIGLAVYLRSIVLGIIAVEREWPCYGALRIGRRKLVGVE